MRHWPPLRHSRTVGRFAAVGVMLALWLGTVALASSAELHRLLHQDAQNVSHTCLVTQIQQHGVAAGFAPAVAPVAATEAPGLARSFDFQFVPTRDYRLSPSRAPPAHFCNEGSWLEAGA